MAVSDIYVYYVCNVLYTGEYIEGYTDSKIHLSKKNHHRYDIFENDGWKTLYCYSWPYPVYIRDYIEDYTDSLIVFLEIGKNSSQVWYMWKWSSMVKNWLKIRSPRKEDRLHIRSVWLNYIQHNQIYGP